MGTTITHSINELIKKITSDIIATHSDLSSVVLIGVVTRGYPIAQRIAKELSSIKKISIPVAKLDITLYRDDLELHNQAITLHETEMPQNITNKIIILVDDVFFHGRTARAAIDAVLDYGRPKKIELAILIDRGYRELPISANYTGITLNTKEKEQIKVLLKEIDEKDEITIND